MTIRGFLLGKFLPPHAGHLFMCRTAQALCDELTVLVCTLDREPIDGRLRHAWMKQLLPGARVIHFDQDVPQEPADHPDFWEIWRNICLDAHPEPVDAVFGSEPYVMRLAQELGARPVVIDPERLAFPVSGTAIRENPYAHWNMVPGPVRSHYQKRIVLTGAESTGKSTLARQLARHFDTLHVPEYGRTYDAFRTGEWTAGSFAEIEAGHSAMREALAPEAGPILIEDTDELSTRVWETALNGTVPTRARPSRLADLYLVLATDLPWRDDGTRYMAETAFREQFQSSLISELSTAGVAWQEIRGLGDARLAAAVCAINSAFPAFAATNEKPASQPAGFRSGIS
ncbi:MAG: AAA family ATPase [Nitratireductor sp.]|nr:AAA family ATPase [Nitratireductor sp.]